MRLDVAGAFTLRTYALALVIAALSCVGAAQTGATGAIAGTVTDSSGAVVPGATVLVTNTATAESREVQTGSDGSFVAPLLSPGNYRIRVTKTDFATQTMNDIRVNVTETAKLAVTLAVGATAQEVQVEANAALVQTESSSLGRVVDDRVITDLPLVTRNYTQVIGLSPGVTANVTNAGDLGRGNGGLTGSGVGFSAHGDRSYDNNFQINGLGVNDVFAQGATSGGIPIPNPDTIQEFKVQTGQFDAAFGRNGGANVNLVTRTGSNEFHGTVFEFFRNTALNANNFFSNRTGQKRAPLNQNQFGFTLGGPVVKNKVLFFGSYQGTRQVNGLATIRTVVGVPLTDDRTPAGIAAVLYGPGSTASDRKGVMQNAFGGVGPAVAQNGSNINPVALKLLQLKAPDGGYLIPTPQAVSNTGSLANRGTSTFNTPSRFNEDQYMLNSDFLHTANSKLTGRFFTATSDQVLAFPAGNLPGFPSTSGNFFVTTSIGHTWTLRANLLNEARFGYNRLRTTTTQQSPFKFSDVGVAAPESKDALPLITIIGSYTLATAPIGQRVQNMYLLNDSLSWVHGRHTLRFGGEISRMQRNFTRFGQPGQLQFQSFADFLLGLNGAQNGTNLFSNIIASVSLNGLFDRALRMWDGSGYVQDDYRVNNRLTLNLGLRWEYMPPMTEELGRFSNVDPRLLVPTPPATGTLAGIVVASNFPGTPPSGVTVFHGHTIFNGNRDNMWAPRFGFAFRPFADSSSIVFRGGYGVNYSTITGQVLTQNTTLQPFGLLSVLSATANVNATFANPFPQPLPTPSSFPQFFPYSPSTRQTVNAVDPNVKPGMIHHYDLNMQWEAVRDFLVEIGYVGTRGTNLQRFLSVNQASLASTSNPIRGATTNTVANIQTRVPFQGWTAPGLSQVQTEGSMWYNGLEASVTKRFSHGLQFLASYTWSKTLDTDGANVDSNSSATGAIGDQNNDRARYGPSSVSRPQRFVISYVYELPWMKSGEGFTGKLLGGWAVSGVTTFQAGHPLTLQGANNNNVFGITSDRAQLAPGCTSSSIEVSGSVDSKLNNYFNSSCVNRANLSAPLSTSNPATWPIVEATATGFGNSGVGIIHGPDQRNFDISLIKHTVIRWPNERANLEFRSEFFNAFNTPQFSDPDTTVSNATFGRITSTAVAPRIVQFALKFNF